MTIITKTQTYKWANAQEWLQNYIDGLCYEELRQAAKNLGSMLDDDTIQDTYQSDMDAQGYFEPEHDDDDSLEMRDDSCGECGHPYKRGDETHYPECSRIEVE